MDPSTDFDIKILQKKNESRNHSEGAAIINEEYEILFYIIPKNASSSIIETLGPRYASKRELNISRLRRAVIYRDPIQRFVSGIKQLYSNNLPQIESDLILLLDKILSFLENTPWEEIDTHIRPQSRFIQNRKIDQILRFEHLEEDWYPLGLPDLLWLHQGKDREAFDRIEQIIRNDESLRLRIMSLYAEDYKIPNYEDCGVVGTH